MAGRRFQIYVFIEAYRHIWLQHVNYNSWSHGLAHQTQSLQCISCWDPSSDHALHYIHLQGWPSIAHGCSTLPGSQGVCRAVLGVQQT
jgi:hypothetical protein